MEEYLRPSTLFGKENFVKYRDEVIAYQKNGVKPKKVNSDNGQLKTAAELFQDAVAARDRKKANQGI